jgi:HSP20 family molecular chaperone IbpA
MSVGAPPPAGAPGGPPFGPHPRARTARESSAASGANAINLQRDANAQAQQIQESINQTNQQGQQRIDYLKEDYNKEYEAESTREDTAVEAEKLKGYERLRAIQRQNQAEEQRVRRQSEDELTATNESFRNRIAKSRISGEEELRDTESRNFQQKEYLQAKGSEEIGGVRTRNATELENLRATGDAKRLRLDEESHKFYDERRATVAAETEKSTAAIDARQHRILGEHTKAANQVAHESNQQLDTLRADTAKKLAAYQERQSDPFYRMVTLGATVREEHDSYVLTANIPEFEQHDVKVNVSGNQLIISGTRRNEEKQELAPGRTQATSSYQSFSEAFPLPHPVDAKRLNRESEGNRLTITLPKKRLTYEPIPARPAGEVARSTIEKPHFPDNLPYVSDRAVAASEARARGNKGEEAPTTEKGPGSAPLT